MSNEKMNNQMPRVIQNSNKPVNNIVSGTTLNRVMKGVLDDLASAISLSMGPAGSNSLILRGNSSEDIVAEYSKDGNKIIKSIKYQYPIEMAIKSEIENATRHIEKEVGDGTSSVVVMASYIFNELCKLDNPVEYETFWTNGDKHEVKNIRKNPYASMRVFKQVTHDISEKIREMGRECTLDDIYKIAMISTNGNEDIANNLYDIYKEYGMNVFIDVSASTNENTYVKSYNGVTIEAGYSDPAMINSIEKNSCIIRSKKDEPVRVYHFAEPIDTPEQLGMFQKIIEDNIMSGQNIPTVILVPQISRDAQAYMRRVINVLNRFDESSYAVKPPLLIVTNYMGLDENYVDHISTLCGCTPIKKYIDDKIRKKDEEQGLAPTIDTVCKFYGTAEEVEADSAITKFVNPSKMYEKDKEGNIIFDENGNMVYSKTYNSIVNFLEAQCKSISSQGGNVGTLGSLKRQLNAIKSNMVELFIGGISISDRDSLRDLVEDAVLNTRSAARNGVGYGANTMGYYITSKMMDDIRGTELDHESGKYYDMVYIIKNAYENVIKTLYGTVYDEDKVNNILVDIFVEKGIPMNINTGEYDGMVLTSIESEPAILDTISKIITIMYTANQAILQAPSLTCHY